MKSTAEQQEAKRREKEKKLQIYRSTVAKIFDKVSGYFCVLLVKVIIFICIITFLQQLFNVEQVIFIKMDNSK